MTRRSKLALGLLLGALVAVGVWWTLVPKIRTASEAEVRAHVAAELLEPLPHPEGGTVRYLALRQALEVLRQHPGGQGKAAALDLADPVVAAVFDVLRSGPLDRTDPEIRGALDGLAGDIFAPVGVAPDERSLIMRLTNGLTTAARKYAQQGDWERVGRQMEASYLLLDCLVQSDATAMDQRWTMSVETSIYKAVLALAARSDLPATLASRLVVLHVADRYGQQTVQRVLRGEFQLNFLLPLFRHGLDGRSLAWAAAGTYDMVETAALLSDLFLEMGHNAALPVSRWSNVMEKQRAATEREAMSWSDAWMYTRKTRYRLLSWYLVPWYRIRMNTAHNSIGRLVVATYPAVGQMERILRARTLQDQVAAALAVSRFRQRAGRDPRSFDELVAAGLLQAVPLDHAKDQPLPFDLVALFKWSPPKRF